MLRHVSVVQHRSRLLHLRSASVTLAHGRSVCRRRALRCCGWRAAALCCSLALMRRCPLTTTGRILQLPRGLMICSSGCSFVVVAPDTYTVYWTVLYDTNEISFQIRTSAFGLVRHPLHPDCLTSASSAVQTRSA